MDICREIAATPLFVGFSSQTRKDVATCALSSAKYVSPLLLRKSYFRESLHMIMIMIMIMIMVIGEINYTDWGQ